MDELETSHTGMKFKLFLTRCIDGVLYCCRKSSGTGESFGN